MSYYYKTTKEKAKEIIRTLDEIEGYDRVVMDWLRENFDIDEQGQFYPFIEIPQLTDSIVRDNEWVKPLLNKTSNRLNQRKAESKELINSWKNYKQKHGFGVKESYTRGDYAIVLRSMFPFGSVDPLIDRKNEVVYLKTSEPSESKSLNEIEMKEYNLKEIELSEDE